MSDKINQCVFIGLPSSGKSSFIGALWHVVEAEEIPGAYTITSQPENREYLNELRSSFLRCQPPERTKIDYVNNISLSVQQKETGKAIEILFPDLSGETYLSQFTDRKLSESYLQQISECGGAMLFINPDNLKRSTLITDSLSMLVEDENHIEDQNNYHQIQWTPNMAQTQIIIVDLIQMIMSKVIKPFKICIIISAWDVIKNQHEKEASEISPKKWLEQNMPLLLQFLSANTTFLNFEIFGVSAQGGNYNEEEDKESLQSIIKQAERIIVRVEETTTSDITLPIKWLFNE